MSTIRYFIPEDGDDESRPNVFLAPKSRHAGSPPTLLQIKDSLPLPGRYHFRFKSPLFPGADREKGAMPVWMDCVQDTAPVPTWRGSIVAKLTRIGLEDDESEDDSEFFSHAPVQAAAPVPAPAPVPAARQTHTPPPQAQRMPPASTSSGELLDVFDQAPAHVNPPVAAAAGMNGHGHAPAPHSGGTANLLDAHHAPAPTANKGGGGTLLDMDGPVYGANPGASNNVHSDFLGMTAPVPTPAPPPAQPTGVATGMPTAVGYNPAAAGAPPAQPFRQPPQQPNMPRPPQNGGANAFSAFTEQNSPFGGLGTPWK